MSSAVEEYVFGPDGEARYSLDETKRLADRSNNGGRIHLPPQYQKLLFLLVRVSAAAGEPVAVDAPEIVDKLKIKVKKIPVGKSRPEVERQRVAETVYRLNRKFIGGSVTEGPIRGDESVGWRFQWKVTRIRSEGVAHVPSKTLPTISGPQSHFTGRVAECDAVIAALQRSRSRANLHSGPGRGKSQLALKVADTLRLRSSRVGQDGQFHIDFGGYNPRRTPLTARQAITELLRKAGDTEWQDSRLSDEQLLEKGRKLLTGRHLLLVADNVQDFSQLSLIVELDFPFAILATSRDQFMSSDFRDLYVGEMNPEDADALLLLLSTCPDGEIRRDVAEICRFNPLALTVAGRAFKQFQGSGIEFVEELEKNFYTSVGQDRGTKDEREVLTAIFSTAYGILPPEVRKCWKRISVFPDTFTPEAALAILPGTESSITASLAGLVVDFSLVIKEKEGISKDEDVSNRRFRYRLHDCTREYAYSLFERDPDFAEISLKHANYYFVLFSRHAQDPIADATSDAGLFMDERENLDAGRQAYARTLELSREQAETFCRVYLRWHVSIHASMPTKRGAWSRVAPRIARISGTTPKNLLNRAKILGLRGMVHAFDGKPQSAHRRYRMALALLREESLFTDPDESQQRDELIGTVRCRIAWYFMDIGDYDSAIVCLETWIAEIPQGASWGDVESRFRGALTEAYINRGRLDEVRRNLLAGLVRTRLAGGRILPSVKELDTTTWERVSSMATLGYVTVLRAINHSASRARLEWGSGLCVRALDIGKEKKGWQHAEAILAQRAGDSFMRWGEFGRADEIFEWSAYRARKWQLWPTLAEALKRRLDVAYNIAPERVAQLTQELDEVCTMLDPAVTKRIRGN